MNSFVLRQALGLIGDDLIADAAVENVVCRRKKWNIGAISGWAACLTVCVLYFSQFHNQYHAEDPHWHLNHVEVHSLEQAEQFYGNNLLLREFIVSGVQTKRTDYSLELEKGGSISDKETWIYLNTSIAYERGLSSLEIFFDTDDSRIEKREKNYFATGDSPLKRIIGDTDIVYTEEYNSTGTRYSVIGQFQYNDAIYFFWMEWKATQGGTEKDIIWDTLTKMLE